MLAVVLCGTAVFAQTQRNCSTNEHMEILIQEDPSILERMQEIEAHTQEILNNPSLERRVDGVITIPVVVHVIWNQNQPQQNISEAQIQSQIDVINEDFRRTNADAANTLPEFLGVAADMEIEFCMASVDPNGNPTNGIERKSSTRSSWGTGTAMKRASSGGLDAWSRDSYLNMWVCNIGSSILGFATFPGGNAADDGVVMSPQYFGSSDKEGPGEDFYLNTPFDLGRTTTHEVGHWLNLRHIWGDGPCASDDGVGDTPRSDNANYNCPLSHTSCSTKDMVQNYMDYTDDACMNIYTEGQKTRSRALFNAGGARAALLESEGCGEAVPTCLPPTGVDATEIGDDYAVVNFNGAQFADWYLIELAENDGPFNIVEQINDPAFGVVSNITFNLGSLSSCTEYTVKITAHCDNLNGDEATELTFTTTGVECEPEVCDVPTNLTSSNITFTQATLSWDPVEGASQYRINGQLKGGPGWFARTRIVEGTSVRTNAIIPFLTYIWRVQADCGDIGWSPYSPYAEFTLNPFLRQTNNGTAIADANPEEVKLFEQEGVFTAFPNPSHGQIKLNYFGQDLENVKLVVTDITGKELKQYDFDLIFSGTQEINISELNRGLYLLNYKKDGINLWTEKVMLVK